VPNFDIFFDTIFFDPAMLRRMIMLGVNGQTFSSLTGQTSGLPKASYSKKFWPSATAGVPLQEAFYEGFEMIRQSFRHLAPAMQRTHN
jgi:hypothetical protein